MGNGDRRREDRKKEDVGARRYPARTPLLLDRHAALLHDTSAGLRFELDLAECVFVLRYVLLQYVEQRLGLLGAYIDALKILDGDLVGSGLIDDAEEQKEIPQVDTDLHAVRVVFPVIGGVGQVDFRRLWRHRPIRYQDSRKSFWATARDCRDESRCCILRVQT